MRIESVYENKFLIPHENESCFSRKHNLSDIERVGLEAIAVEFIAQYEEEMMGEPATAQRRSDIRDVVRWNDDSVDLLDGVYDTYEFDGYLFGSVWSTENGIPMLTAAKIPDDCEDWEPYDVWSEFECVYFRLN